MRDNFPLQGDNTATGTIKVESSGTLTINQGSLNNLGLIDITDTGAGFIHTATVTDSGTIRVEVTDRAGPGTPELRPADRDAEGGRGLQLVAGLAARWGWRRRGGRLVTWFELRA